ncbi:hypothetical protein ACFSBZ_06930 [Amnibacterium flavum]|uniref:hypothetical protein n=1 Tax=Amnibacterium flavum TaxID=2173173 RepID=UPI0014022F45|nr:hypothetical protein [Amnibacterium flavum]
MSLPLLGSTAPAAMLASGVDLMPAAVVTLVVVGLAVALIVASLKRGESDE